MQSETCPQESAVLKACRSNNWNDGLQKHFEVCPTCQEADRSAKWIRNASAIKKEQFPPMPDPDVLWFRARIAVRERESSRAVWFSALRKTLLYGPLSAGATWFVLDFLRSEGIGVEQGMQGIPMVFGIVPLLAAVLTAVLVYFTPSLASRIRSFRPF